MTLVGISIGYLLVILDATAVNVALPLVHRDLGGGVSALQWVVDGYALVLAAFLLGAGAIGDRVGARRVFVSGLTLFAAASAACGAAPSLGALVAARVVQGLGAAMLVPSSLALLRATHPDERARARALSVWGGIGGIGAVGGPLLGGALASSVGWRLVFLVNVPVAALGYALIRGHVPVATSRDRRVGFDPPAQALAVTATASLTFALIEAGPRGWGDPLVLGGLAVAGLALAAFVAVERRVRAPMLPLSLFRRPAFGAATFVGLLINFGLYGQLFVLNLAFQQARGDDALHAGLAIAPEAAAAALGTALIGGALGRRGPRMPMIFGLTLGAAGFLALAVAGIDAPYGALLPGLLAVGYGMGTTMPAATAAVVTAAGAERAGAGAGALNAARQLGGAIGVALLGTIAGASGVGSGLRSALLVAGGAFALGVPVTVAWVGRQLDDRARRPAAAHASRRHGALDADHRALAVEPQEVE